MHWSHLTGREEHTTLCLAGAKGMRPSSIAEHKRTKGGFALEEAWVWGLGDSRLVTGAM